MKIHIFLDSFLTFIFEAENANECHIIFYLRDDVVGSPPLFALGPPFVARPVLSVSQVL